MFDGHGPWGHMISKEVRKSLPARLLNNWQRNLSMDYQPGKNLLPFNLWKQSCLKTYAAIDEELKQHPRIDSFYSGTTALTVVKQVINWNWNWNFLQYVSLLINYALHCIFRGGILLLQMLAIHELCWVWLVMMGAWNQFSCRLISGLIYLVWFTPCLINLLNPSH